MGSKRKCDDSPSFWKTFVVAPDSVDRPLKGHLKGYFYFFANENQNNWDDIWHNVECATTIGYLGHFSAISDDGKVIVVHAAHPKDIPEMKRIELNLGSLGIIGIRFRTKYETNDPKKYKCEEGPDLSVQDFQYWRSICLNGKLLTKQQFQQNRQLFAAN